jgi:hypothetical protein
VEPTLTIGDFSRATHLSVKMLRDYHDIGLLQPSDVDRHLARLEASLARTQDAVAGAVARKA